MVIQQFSIILKIEEKLLVEQQGYNTSVLTISMSDRTIFSIYE